jgi:hypothetical protein
MNPMLDVLKVEFREYCVRWLSLKIISDVFEPAGFRRADASGSNLSGERRTLVAEYYEDENWEDIATLRRFASVLERTLLVSFLQEENKDELRALCNKCGFEVDSSGHTVHLATRGVGRQVKNLIFAADGPKPRLVLSDSVSNDIEIVENAEYCLVYDRPIQSHGLLLRELVDWWEETQGNDRVSERESRNTLLLRLTSSTTKKISAKSARDFAFRHLPLGLPQ